MFDFAYIFKGQYTCAGNSTLPIFGSEAQALVVRDFDESLVILLINESLSSRDKKEKEKT